jgi:hypothetical protein
MMAITAQLQGDDAKLKGVYLIIEALAVSAANGDITNPVFSETMLQVLRELQTDVSALKSRYDTLGTWLSNAECGIMDAIWLIQNDDNWAALAESLFHMKTVAEAVVGIRPRP